MIMNIASDLPLEGSSELGRNKSRTAAACCIVPRCSRPRPDIAEHQKSRHCHAQIPCNPLKSVSHHHINALCHQKERAYSCKSPSSDTVSALQREDADQTCKPLGERSNNPRYVRKICNKTCHCHERSPQYLVSSCMNCFVLGRLIRSRSPWTIAYLSCTPSTCSRLTR